MTAPDSKLQRAVAGALRSTIDAHGPITRKWVGSAVKRVLGALETWKKDTDETILCAAIWVDDGESYDHEPVETGLVFCAHRHHIIFDQIGVWGKVRERRERGLREVQGFLTSKGRFVDRKEALQIALDAGQVRIEDTHMPHVGLDSSDLY